MDIRTQDFAQRVMEDMGRRMVEHRGVAPLAIDAECNAPPALELIRLTAHQAPNVKNRTVGLARIDDFEQRARFGLDYAAVADLSPAFGIKGRLRGNYNNPMVGVSIRGEQLGFDFVLMVDEARRNARPQSDFRRDRLIFARRPSPLALLLHEALEPGDIDINALLSKD